MPILIFNMAVEREREREKEHWNNSVDNFFLSHSDLFSAFSVPGHGVISILFFKCKMQVAKMKIG